MNFSTTGKIKNKFNLLIMPSYARFRRSTKTSAAATASSSAPNACRMYCASRRPYCARIRPRIAPLAKLHRQSSGHPANGPPRDAMPWTTPDPASTFKTTNESSAASFPSMTSMLPRAAFEFHEWVRSHKALKIDRMYYVENQLVKPLTQLTQMFGSVDDLFEEALADLNRQRLGMASLKRYFSQSPADSNSSEVSPPKTMGPPLPPKKKPRKKGSKSAKKKKSTPPSLMRFLAGPQV